MSLDQPSLGSAFKLDKYELTREIAGSGVATTWTAKTPDDDKAYVVLRLHRNVTKKADAIDAFLRDAATGKLAPHANLVPVAQCGQAEGEVFVACEQFAGESLSTLITQAKTDGLAPGVALRIGREMLEGLAAAHGASPAVAHGELNPFHIIVGKDGVTRIAGFGWAQALSRANPILYMVNAFRYGFLGHSDVHVGFAFAFMIAAVAVLFGACVWLMEKGTGIRE